MSCARIFPGPTLQSSGHTSQCNHSASLPTAPRAAALLVPRPESRPLPFLRSSDSNTAAVVCPYFSLVLARCRLTPSAPTPRRPGLATPPDPGALLDCDAESGTTTADPPAPSAPTCWHRCDRSSAYDASTLPSTAGWPPVLRVPAR